MKKFLLSTVLNCVKFDQIYRFQIGIFYQQFSRKSFMTRIKSRCIFNYSGRSIVTFFRVSRHTLKRLINSGRIYGFSKSSW